MKRYKSTKTLEKDILREIKRARRSAKQNRLVWFTVYAQKHADGKIDVWTYEGLGENEYFSGGGIAAAKIGYNLGGRLFFWARDGGSPEATAYFVAEELLEKN